MAPAARRWLVLALAPVAVSVLALSTIDFSWKSGTIGALLGLAVAAGTWGALVRWQSVPAALLTGVVAGLTSTTAVGLAYSNGAPNPNAWFYTSIVTVVVSAAVSLACLMGFSS